MMGLELSSRVALERAEVLLMMKGEMPLWGREVGGKKGGRVGRKGESAQGAQLCPLYGGAACSKSR